MTSIHILHITYKFTQNLSEKGFLNPTLKAQVNKEKNG